MHLSRDILSGFVVLLNGVHTKSELVLQYPVFSVRVGFYSLSQTSFQDLGNDGSKLIGRQDSTLFGSLPGLGRRKISAISSCFGQYFTLCVALHIYVIRKCSLSDVKFFKPVKIELDVYIFFRFQYLSIQIGKEKLPDDSGTISLSFDQKPFLYDCLSLPVIDSGQKMFCKKKKIEKRKKVY